MSIEATSDQARRVDGRHEVAGSTRAVALRERESPPPAVLYFGLFDDCNAKCNMCDCWRLPRSRRDIAYYLELLEIALALKPKAIRFTGGEPLLLRGLVSLIEHAARRGTRVSVISNGRILAGKVESLAAAGCAEIVLSIDAIGTNHDTIRGTRGLYERCLRAITAIARTDMNLGVNTVVQRSGIDDLPGLARVLLSQPRTPAWWHLIPVRDHPELKPTAEQLDRFRQFLPDITRDCAQHSVKLVADVAMFDPGESVPCDVPSFAAYLRADTGELFGCNMLAYAGESIGNVLHERPEQVWAGMRATALRARCATSSNAACSRCDRSSRSMNHALRSYAVEGSMGIR